ncbi:hypothetical protein F5Y05DRAFT_237820 [Hypoxylon sp. FL0543]|nr:hypothetical protein F5Y05DRAFT_237820 [Hypoxylon sp. FL0543]
MSASTRKSSRSNSIDDIDAITPCPLTRSGSEEIDVSEFIGPVGKFEGSRSPSPSSECSSVGMDASRDRRRASLKALEEGTDGDPGRLWERMLALQQTYGCYNSARMSAALSSGDVSLLLPSKACLNLLNENMAFLPDETGDAFGEWQPTLNGGRGH